jgi:hypothetical protein
MREPDNVVVRPMNKKVMVCLLVTAKERRSCEEGCPIRDKVSKIVWGF